MQDLPISPPGAERPIPPERRLRVADVRKVEQLTPHMRRITLASIALMDFPVRRPAQWVKLFVPAPEADGSTGRAYTIRRFRADLCELDIDFVLHGAGPCSSWAERAKPGDVVQIAGPRSGFRLESHVSHLLIGGDETALPAIGAILESLPPTMTARAIVEIGSEADALPLASPAAVDLTWMPRNGREAGVGTELVEAMTTAAVSGERSAVWFAAEASMVRMVRRHFQIDRAVPRSRLTLSGYWKKGETDFRDRDGDQ